MLPQELSQAEGTNHAIDPKPCTGAGCGTKMFTSTCVNTVNNSYEVAGCTMDIEAPVMSTSLPNMDVEQDPTQTHSSEHRCIIRYCSWNARSINNCAKLKTVWAQDADLIMLQEVWRPSAQLLELLPCRRVVTMRPEGRGGGSLIAFNSTQIKTCTQPYIVNQDTSIIKCTVYGDRIIWLCSIYLHKDTKNLLMDTISEIQNVVPTHEWSNLLIAGDWNIKVPKTNKMTANPSTDASKSSLDDKRTEAVDFIAKEMGLKIYAERHSRGDRSLDYVLALNNITIRNLTLKLTPHLSDHSMLNFEAVMTRPATSAKTFCIPDRRKAETFTLRSLEQAKDSLDFIKAMEHRLSSAGVSIAKTIKHKPKKRELLDRIMEATEEDSDLKLIVQNYWREKIENCEANRYSHKSKEAFDFLKKMYRYHEYNRRDGSIIYRTYDQNGNVVSDTDKVNKEIMDHLRVIQTKESEPLYNTRQKKCHLCKKHPSTLIVNNFLNKMIHKDLNL